MKTMKTKPTPASAPAAAAALPAAGPRVLAALSAAGLLVAAGTVAAVTALASAPLPASAQTTPDRAIEVALATRAGRMAVPVHAPDGTELTFLVTTGSAVTVLSESTAARFDGRALTLGDAPVNLEHARTVPDRELTVDGRAMDGVVGANTLNAFDVLFDAPGGRLVLKPVGRAVAWPGVELSDPVRLRVYHGVVLALDVGVNGVELPAMLELGAPALLVNQAVLDRASVDDGTADLELGASTFRGVAVELSDHPVIGRFSPDGDPFVVVGTPPALACPVSVSWVHRELRTCVP